MTDKKTTKLLRAVQKLEGLMEAQDLEGAARLAEDIEMRAAEAGIQSAALSWIRAIVDDNRGRHEQALDAIDVAVQLDPLALAFRNSRAIIVKNLRASVATSNASNVPRLWRVLVEAGEADDNVHIALARHHLGTGHNQEALAVLTAVTTLNPSNSEAWHLRIQTAEKLGLPVVFGIARAEAAVAGVRAQAFVTPLVGES